MNRSKTRQRRQNKWDKGRDNVAIEILEGERHKKGWGKGVSDEGRESECKPQEDEQ